MKKIFFPVALFAITTIQSAFGQENIKTDPAELLSLYYNIKDALVGGNANAASAKAADFVNTINSVDASAINTVTLDALRKEAGAIAATKNIKAQREQFSSFSDNMLALAKTAKLSAEPIYQQYCPMKKASWLSNQKGIKNPYFGNAMLTCGKVETTLR